MNRPVVVSLIGGECSGKTSLARALAEALPGLCVPEALRAFVDRHARAPLATEQREVMREQIAAERIALTTARDSGCSYVISDSGALMTAIYSIEYFDDRSLLDEAIAHQSSYALTVWCDIEFPWQPDGVHRDGRQYRARVHEHIQRVIEVERAGEMGPVLIARGSIDERVQLVREHLSARAGA